MFRVPLSDTQSVTVHGFAARSGDGEGPPVLVWAAVAVGVLAQVLLVNEPRTGGCRRPKPPRHGDQAPNLRVSLLAPLLRSEVRLPRIVVNPAR